MVEVSKLNQNDIPRQIHPQRSIHTHPNLLPTTHKRTPTTQHKIHNQYYRKYDTAMSMMSSRLSATALGYRIDVAGIVQGDHVRERWRVLAGR